MRIGIGNNLAQTRSFTLMVSGARLFKTALVDGAWLTYIDVRDADGKSIAKLSNNAWNYRADGYEVDTSPDNLSLVDSEGRSIVHITRPEPDYIWIRSLDLRSIQGDRITIESPHLDLRFRNAAGDVLMMLRRCAMLVPAFSVELLASDSDPAATVIGANFIHLSPNAREQSIERCTFGGPADIPSPRRSGTSVPAT